MRFHFFSSDDELQYEGSDEADEINAKQFKKITQPATIWHAVSSFQFKEGKDSWEICKLIMDGCKWASPWMTGQDRGVFGETPLHLALLFNEPNEEFEKFFQELWSKCPKIHAAQYTHALYAGENVLHIAIIRKAGMPIIRTIVESPRGPTLLSQRANGLFFKDPRRSDGCCSILGEFPLCFAACTNQLSIFDYLLSKGADPAARTSEGNTLLHLLVLNTDAALPSSCDAAGTRCIYLDIFDAVEARLRPSGAYDVLRTARNAAGHTPLSLAAAAGSEAMFEHLFRKELAVTWTYGPAVCRRLYLAGIDVPLYPDEAPPPGAAPSVLEVPPSPVPRPPFPVPRPPSPVLRSPYPFPVIVVVALARPHCRGRCGQPGAGRALVPEGSGVGWAGAGVGWEGGSAASEGLDTGGGGAGMRGWAGAGERLECHVITG